MIIGNGLVANAFKQLDSTDELIVFASGVSNSKILSELDCEREFKLLKSVIADNKENRLLVYFSTYSIDNESEKGSAYVLHKLHLEDYIAKNAPSYLIIRTSNIVGKSGNSSTVFNFLFEKIKSNSAFELWKNAKRNFLDVDHLALMVMELVKAKSYPGVYYLLNPNDIKVLDLVGMIEIFLNKKAIYTAIEHPKETIAENKELSGIFFEKLGIEKENRYIDYLIQKYYSNEKIQ